MKNILLIHASKKVLLKRDNLFTNESLTPSLGLASISAHCRQHDINSKIIDLRLPHRTLNDVITYIEENRPILVGITAFTSEIASAGKVAKLIKQQFPKTIIVVGGPHPSAIPIETLQEFCDFDIAVVGEGEETIVELVNALDGGTVDNLKDIRGIAGTINSEIRLSLPRGPIHDINVLPFPAWDLFELEYYTNVFPVSASRGCPYSCYFCNPNYLGKKVRIRTFSRVVDEVEWLVEKYGVRKIQFADATLSLLKKSAIQMCDELIKRGLNKRIEWDCETRADSVNEQLLERMKEAGCRWLALGVETGNERILEVVSKKGENKEQIRQAVKMAKKVGIKVRCFFILGHYGETVDTIKETINFALELNPDALSFGLMVPNPGTEIRKLAEQRTGGLRILHNRWEDYNQFNYSCYELDNLPLKELKKWQSNAYFSFYIRHPLKAIGLFLDKSSYNYNIKALLKIPLMLLIRKLKK
ncbi:MAG: B12-binding domain-containing radical SAM protein [Omnitrophica bacterium]|nr:B12-binding domain-containing radical SAM protein [Candidatus Omnitrophota bacterium]